MALTYDFTKTTDEQQMLFGLAIAKFLGINDDDLCELVAKMPTPSDPVPVPESARLFGRHYLHNTLPWKLMFCNIQELEGDDDKSAEEFLWRIAFLERTDQCGAFPGVNGNRFIPNREMLRGITIYTNVSNQTRKQFVKERLSRITRNIDGFHKGILKNGEVIKPEQVGD